ncbi:hypothetical protein, partial [Vibrio aestuarianus]|uniref:hypothetical protein n=1 Tax=Vibrio aestuarianus TaxID=28171 RepID=UPI0030B8992A
QPAENTEQIINEIVALTLKTHPTHNALLRCEQRNTEASAYHLKHKMQRIAKMPSVANHS